MTMASVPLPPPDYYAVSLTLSDQSLMRIYIQVPHRKTEMDDTNTRGRQAIVFTPPELISYQDLSQKGSNIPKLMGYKSDAGLLRVSSWVGLLSGLCEKSFQGYASRIGTSPNDASPYLLSFMH